MLGPIALTPWWGRSADPDNPSGPPQLTLFPADPMIGLRGSVVNTACCRQLGRDRTWPETYAVRNGSARQPTGAAHRRCKGDSLGLDKRGIRELMFHYGRTQAVATFVSLAR